MPSVWLLNHSLFWLTHSFTQSLLWQVAHFAQFVTYSFYDSITCLLVYLISLFIPLLVSYVFTCVLVWSEIHSVIFSFSCLLHTHSSSCQSCTYRKYCQSFACSLTHSLDPLFACSVDSFADKFEKNAECSPLECWECDSWILWTSRLPQQHDCIKQWIQTWWLVHNKAMFLTPTSWKTLSHFTSGCSDAHSWKLYFIWLECLRNILYI